MIKNSFIYLFSSILNKLTPFLLIPILTRFLTPSEYGLVALYQVAITFGVAICGFGLHLNIAKAYPVMDSESFGKFNFNVFLILLISSSFGLMACLFLSGIKNVWYGIESYWWCTIPLVSFAIMLFLFVQTIFRACGKPWLYATFELGSTLLNLTISLLLVIVYSLGWQGRATGVMVAPLLMGVAALLFMKNRRWLISSINKTDLRNIMQFSLPLLPHAISSALIAVSDRFFLESMVGKSELGLYSVGYSFGMVIMLVTDAFAKAWTPWFLRTINEPLPGSRRKIVFYIYCFLIALVIGVPVYIVIASIALPYVVGGDFVDAISFIPVISVGYLFFGIYQLFFPFLVTTSSTKILGFISTFGAFINISLNFILIPIYGSIGAAWATLFAYFIVAILVIFVSARLVKMPWIKSA